MPLDPCSGPPWASTVTVAPDGSGAMGPEPPQPMVTAEASTTVHPIARARGQRCSSAFRNVVEFENMASLRGEGKNVCARVPDDNRVSLNSRGGARSGV